MPRVIHFQIHADNPERAVEFYHGLFAWEFTKWERPMPYWFVKTGEDSQPGIKGGLFPRHSPIDGQAGVAYVCTVDVSWVDMYLTKALATVGRLALPRMPIPGIRWLA